MLIIKKGIIRKEGRGVYDGCGYTDLDSDEKQQRQRRRRRRKIPAVHVEWTK